LIFAISVPDSRQAKEDLTDRGTISKRIHGYIELPNKTRSSEFVRLN
jgi:hypothetical protein